MKKIYSVLITFSLVILLTGKAMAHKVNIFAYPEGDMVKTESYFPDGRPVDNGKIEVYDNKEAKLLEGTTDKDGMFAFKIPKKEDLNIVIIASMGHKNSYLLTAAELSGQPAEIPQDSQAANTSEENPQQAEQAAPEASNKQRRTAEAEPFPVAAVLGGLGFIFGLTALVMQITGKKRG